MTLVKKFHKDGKAWKVELEQDVEDIIERNKKLQNAPQSKRGPFYHIASIPNIFINRWLNEEYDRGNTHIKFASPEMDKMVERKLKDPDWKWLRTDK